MMLHYSTFQHNTLRIVYLHTFTRESMILLRIYGYSKLRFHNKC